MSQGVGKRWAGRPSVRQTSKRACRGPRMDLWVVVVTMSQYSKGLLASWAATRPLASMPPDPCSGIVVACIGRSDTRAVVPDVGHVAHEHGAAGVGNLTEALVVPITGVGTAARSARSYGQNSKPSPFAGTGKCPRPAAADDELWFEEVDALLQLLKVNQAGVLVHLGKGHGAVEEEEEVNWAVQGDETGHACLTW